MDDPVVMEYFDILPDHTVMPTLTTDEVERFVTLGEHGMDRLVAGDVTAAEQAFLGQVEIFSLNPEPFVALALVEAGRGEKKRAMEYVRLAVARGLTDLRRIERAEAWIPLRGNADFRRLQEMVPGLVDVEKRWARWSSFQSSPPESLQVALDAEARARRKIEAMSPALGPRLTALWTTLIDRVTAAMIEAYLREHADAPDMQPAIERLMTIYAGGPLREWQALDAEMATELAAASALVVHKFPESPARPVALVGLALAWNTERDKKGRLSARAVRNIDQRLEEVLERYPDSAVTSTAAVGLILTELDAGEADAAAERYAALRRDRVDSPKLLEDVRVGLGSVALELAGIPDFDGTCVDGTPLGDEALDGKVAVLDFWATWCQPCVAEFPTLRRIHERYGDDVVLVGVNLDHGEDLATEDLDRWIAGQGVPGSHLHDGLSWDSELVRKFGVTEIPFNVVVAADGSVLAINQHGKKLEKAVTAAVKSRSARR